MAATHLSGPLYVGDTNAKSLAAADLTGTTTRFTVSGGPIKVLAMGLHITTALPAGANTLQFSYTSTGGSPNNLSGATDTASAGDQQLFMLDGAKATGPIKTTDVGVQAAGQPLTNMPIVLGTGVIRTIFSGGPPATGAATLFMQWVPLTPTSKVE